MRVAVWAIGKVASAAPLSFRDVWHLVGFYGDLGRYTAKRHTYLEMERGSVVL